eukprot:11384987-Heterocapsa_arctica.AAC.1
MRRKGLPLPIPHHEEEAGPSRTHAQGAERSLSGSPEEMASGRLGAGPLPVRRAELREERQGRRPKIAAGRGGE